MCWSSDVVSITCSAAVTAGDVAVVSVNAAGADVPAAVLELALSPPQAAISTPARSALEYR